MKRLFLLFLLTGCSGLPSKTEALEIIKQEAKEDVNCTLPLEHLQKLKMQHTSKAICVPKAGADAAGGCVEALVTAGLTKPMSAGYMLEWPDEVKGTSFDKISPYDRRARAEVFKTCVEMADLRNGQFQCAEATPERVVKVERAGETKARVRYARDLKLDAKLPAIEAACTGLTRPAVEAQVTLERGEKKWALAKENAE